MLKYTKGLSGQEKIKYNILWLYEISVTQGLVWDLQKQMINVYLFQIVMDYGQGLSGHFFKSQVSF
jgi:hypothetical protein